jgi:abortive infection bacteriophage resistance protein
VTLEPAKPLNDAQMCGSFFIYTIIMEAETKPFIKSYSSPHELVKLLQNRGLHILDEKNAEHYIKFIGYYRLSAYMYPLLENPKSQHLFKKGATFKRVINIYLFDKKLRTLIFNELEKIEIAVRSTIVNVASESLDDSFWMTNVDNFIDKNKFQKTVALIDAEFRHSREDFILHFKKTYSDSYPPAWIISEILPLGVMTNIYSNLKNKSVKKKISQVFDLQVVPFESWLTIITLTRNSCCHHARVWNKRNTIRPTIPNKMVRSWLTMPIDVLKVYFNLCIIKYFLGIISPSNTLKLKLQSLFEEYPEIDKHALGFPSGWEDEPLWE